jgi:hypothetical protein
MSDTSKPDAKTAAGIRQMRENAKRVLADPKQAKLHERARKMLENMPEPPPAAVRASAAPRDPAYDAAVARIVEVAKEATRRFDLSAETAKAAGVPAPHKLTAADGKPKTGGGVMSKRFRRNPYISYRGAGGIAVLHHAVPPEGEGYWWGGVAAVGAVSPPEGDGARMGEEEAVAAFFAALEQLAPARS